MVGVMEVCGRAGDKGATAQEEMVRQAGQAFGLEQMDQGPFQGAVMAGGGGV